MGNFYLKNFFINVNKVGKCNRNLFELCGNSFSILIANNRLLYLNYI